MFGRIIGMMLVLAELKFLELLSTLLINVRLASAWIPVFFLTLGLKIQLFLTSSDELMNLDKIFSK